MNPDHTQRTPRPGRRTVLRTAVLGTAAGLALPTAASAASPARTTAAPPGAVSRPPSGTSGTAGSVSWRWLGTSGWRMDLDGRTVLFDPYVTRFSTGLFDGAFDPATELETDEGLVDRHAGRPEVILVSHSHWDHLNDVPYLAKTTGARVVGTETTYHLLCSLGVDPAQLSVVRGGEVLDFGGYTVEAVASVHSRNKNHSYFSPGTLNAPPATAPTTIAELPEGNTLAFQVTFGNGPSVFLMGGSDFIEREVTGLRPGIAMVAVPSSTATYRYVPRLMRALGGPGVVVPVHWDNFEVPLSGPPPRDPGADLEGLVAGVRAASPTSRVVVPDYRTVYGPDMRPVK
ncbi:MBL fold metallo-hydrolase [Streptomyces sp. NPDC056652]|uniref:MBL fold metallo-hydrolase n=1 Tax=Streptomyces sp. NPDC056652 TaxID=3345893 RepID=UPI0036762538